MSRSTRVSYSFGDVSTYIDESQLPITGDDPIKYSLDFIPPGETSPTPITDYVPASTGGTFNGLVSYNNAKTLTGDYNFTYKSWVESAISTAITSGNFTTLFNSLFATKSISDLGTKTHNSTTSIQGGTTAQYYHLTLAQHTIVTRAATGSLSGYLTSTDWNTFNNKLSSITAGTGITIVGTTISSKDSEIDHNSLLNYVAAQHIPLDDTKLTTAYVWSASKIISYVASQIPSAITDYVSKASGGNYDNLIGYSSDLTITGDTTIPHKKYVDDTITSEISSYDTTLFGGSTGSILEYLGTLSIVDIGTRQHNSLTTFQGGTSGQYYHLTQTQHTEATQYATGSVNGLLSSTDWTYFDGKLDAFDTLESSSYAEFLYYDSGYLYYNPAYLDHNSLLNYEADEHIPMDDTLTTASNLWSASKTLASITDLNLSLSDIVDNNASTSKHGFLPKLADDVSKYLRSDGQWIAIPVTYGNFLDSVITMQEDATDDPCSRSAIVFTGAGLDDLTTADTFTASSNISYVVEIDGTGTPDTFKWSDDGGSTWDATTVNITGSAQLLNNGVYITFAATTGHTSGNNWAFTFTAPANGDRYIILDSGALHSNFKTINKDLDGNSLTLGNKDIVQYVTASSEFRIAFDSSLASSPATVTVGLDTNGNTNHDWTYNITDDIWVDRGTATLHNSLSDLNTADYRHLTATEYTFFSTGTQGDVIYVSATNTWAKLAKTATANSFIRNSGTSNNPAWSVITTTEVSEGTNLYYTNARAIASALTGYTAGSGTISAADSILGAIQKLGYDQHVAVTLATNHGLSLTGQVLAMGTPSTLTSVTTNSVTTTTHTHAITCGIANTNIVKIDEASVADNDYAKFTANGLEGRTYAEVKTDLGIVTQTPQALTQSGATLTWDVSAGYNGRVTLTASVTTFNFSGAVSGDSGILTVIQGGSGSYTLAEPSGHLVQGGSWTLRTAVGSKDLLAWYYDGTDYFWNYDATYA